MEPITFEAAEYSQPGKQQSALTCPSFAVVAPAFSHRSERELRLAYYLFRLMAHPGLMKLATGLASRAIQSPLPVKYLIKKTAYKLFCGGETVQEALEVVNKLDQSHIHTVLDYAAEAEESEAGFERAKKQILRNIALAKNEKGIGAISVKLSGLGYLSLYEKMARGEQLEQEEKIAFRRTGLRLEEICREAAAAGVSVYIDAEESWLQEPMDALAEQMMGLFNKEKVVVFNTFQMYRTDRLDYLRKLVERTQGSSFCLGIKIVRGAYWEKERERAVGLGLPSPVFDTKAETDHDFNQAIFLCLDHLPRVQLCIATHNQESTELLVREIVSRNIENHKKWLHFSQLYGMSDHLSYALAQAGYQVSKYLPYGEIEKALPYLIRRAEENTAIAGQMGRELQLLHDELKRRKRLNSKKTRL